MQIAFIGFGEAASAFVKGWAGQGHNIAAYDIKSADPSTGEEIAERTRHFGVRNAPTLKEAMTGADLVFSTVTADQAVAAAQSAAPHMPQGAVFCDLNSCAPGSKRGSAAVIEAGGGRYVDVAVMEPVYPELNMVKSLISGPHATDIEAVLTELPMSVRPVGDEVGRASAIKMIRSIMVKGMEALTAECVMAAVAAGVADEVLPSLLGGHPKIDVSERAAYNFERSLRHGERRAAEMEEVAATLTELGLPNGMSAASVEWQRLIAASGIDLPDEPSDAQAIARALLPSLKRES